MNRHQSASIAIDLLRQKDRELWEATEELKVFTVASKRH